MKLWAGVYAPSALRKVLNTWVGVINCRHVKIPAMSVLSNIDCEESNAPCRTYLRLKCDSVDVDRLSSRVRKYHGMLFVGQTSRGSEGIVDRRGFGSKIATEKLLLV